MEFLVLYVGMIWLVWIIEEVVPSLILVYDLVRYFSKDWARTCFGFFANKLSNLRVEDTDSSFSLLWIDFFLGKSNFFVAATFVELILEYSSELEIKFICVRGDIC